MLFEHIIEINDPEQPELPRLSAAQLWRGLLLRVRQPELFLDALERAVVTEVTPGLFERELDYGGFQVKDRVTTSDDLRIDIDVLAPPRLAGMTLRIQPESPAAGVLTVRFLYAAGSGATAKLTTAERRAREAAWLNADRDTVALIRRLAAAGKLGE